MAAVLGLGIALSGSGVLLLRLGWGRPVRAWTVFGWTLIGLGLVLLGAREGAWGIAVTTLGIMAVVGAILAHAAWSTPASRAAAPRQAPGVSPFRLDRADLARRLAIFFMVVPAGFAATQLLAFGAEAAARRNGWEEADAIVLALILQPIAWAGLASIQMLRERPAQMLFPALPCAATGLLLWWPL